MSQAVIVTEEQTRTFYKMVLDGSFCKTQFLVRESLEKSKLSLPLLAGSMMEPTAVISLSADCSCGRRMDEYLGFLTGQSYIITPLIAVALQ